MGRSTTATASREAVRELAVVLHDLAWLLPRSIDVEAERDPRVASLPTSELEIMRLLIRRPGLTVGQVARELGLQRTNASTGIRTLIGRGLIDRERDDADRRIVRLSPTPLAIGNREVREAVWAELLAGRLQALSATERARILGCAEPLRALAAALSVE